IELTDIGKWRGHWEHKGTAVLMSLPIHVLSITDPFHKNELDPVRDLIDHSIGPDPDAVERKAAGQLYTTFGSWVSSKSFQSDQDLSVIRFRDLSQITCGRSRQLYGIFHYFLRRFADLMYSSSEMVGSFLRDSAINTSMRSSKPSGSLRIDSRSICTIRFFFNSSYRKLTPFIWDLQMIKIASVSINAPARPPRSSGPEAWSP